MGAAQTGTGKTAAFALPLLQRMLKHENASTSPARHPVRALVLLPTRELADQVAEQVRSVSYTHLDVYKRQAQNSPASVMSITTSVAVRNATSPCSRPKPESV